jgi:hypothetical protein
MYNNVGISTRYSLIKERLLVQYYSIFYVNSVLKDFALLILNSINYSAGYYTLDCKSIVRQLLRYLGYNIGTPFMSWPHRWRGR